MRVTGELRTQVDELRDAILGDAALLTIDQREVAAELNRIIAEALSSWRARLDFSDDGEPCVVFDGAAAGALSVSLERVETGPKLDALIDWLTRQRYSIG